MNQRTERKMRSFLLRIHMKNGFQKLGKIATAIQKILILKNHNKTNIVFEKWNYLCWFLKIKEICIAEKSCFKK